MGARWTCHSGWTEERVAPDGSGTRRGGRRKSGRAEPRRWAAPRRTCHQTRSCTGQTAQAGVPGRRARAVPSTTTFPSRRRRQEVSKSALRGGNKHAALSPLALRVRARVWAGGVVLRTSVLTAVLYGRTLLAPPCTAWGRRWRRCPQQLAWRLRTGGRAGAEAPAGPWGAYVVRTRTQREPGCGS